MKNFTFSFFMKCEVGRKGGRERGGRGMEREGGGEKERWRERAHI